MKILSAIITVLIGFSAAAFPPTPKDAPDGFKSGICGNPSVNSNPGAAEKYVYKRFTTPKGKENELKFVLVRPVDNLAIKKRPLVIGIHSGGFIDFCPVIPCYVKYSENILTPNFTPKGFATISIQYRLTAPLDFKPLKISDNVLRETQYKAAQDVREAIRYIFANADKLGIDTENVFVVGTSAGAITALHTAYLDNEEVPKDLAQKYGLLEKLPKIRGVVSLSGAIYDLSYLKFGEKIPLMIFHGSEDKIVPYEKGFYLMQKHLTPVYGGRAVYEEALKQGISAKGLFLDVGHTYSEQRKSEIFAEANKFIRENLACGTPANTQKIK